MVNIRIVVRFDLDQNRSKDFSGTFPTDSVLTAGNGIRMLAQLRMIERGAGTYLSRAASALGYSFAVGAAAFILALSMVPFASILVVAVLLRRDRWAETVVLSSLGAATGGLALYLIFHHLGWSQILAAYPDLLQAKAWSDATRWVSAYGIWALLVIAASPLPQTPALIFAAVSQLPTAELFLALFLGKLLKYGTYGFVAAKFPSWLAARQASAIRFPI